MFNFKEIPTYYKIQVFEIDYNEVGEEYVYVLVQTIPHKYLTIGQAKMKVSLLEKEQPQFKYVINSIY